MCEEAEDALRVLPVQDTARDAGTMGRPGCCHLPTKIHTDNPSDDDQLILLGACRAKGIM